MTDSPTDTPQFPHEMFGDMSSYEAEGCTPCDTSVDQYECRGCHDRAHRAYAFDIAEIVDGTVVRDEGHPTIMPDDAYHGPTKFLMVWHARAGHCPLLVADAPQPIEDYEPDGAPDDVPKAPPAE